MYEVDDLFNGLKKYNDNAEIYGTDICEIVDEILESMLDASKEEKEGELFKYQKKIFAKIKKECENKVNSIVYFS